MQKHDPYLNVDCGLLNPVEHGEVFVTKDGLETDLDLGNYERFLHQKMSHISSITAGKIYQELLNEERNQKYQGKTINIYDVASKVKEKIFAIAKQENSDCLVVELGGTLGDNDLKPFLIAAAQLQRSLPKNAVAFVFLVYVYYLNYLSQFKSKPAQNAVANLRNNGIEPDFVILRSFKPVDLPTREKFARVCYLNPEKIFNVCEQNIYSIPSLLVKNGFFEHLVKQLTIPNRLDVAKIELFANKISSLTQVTKKIRIFVINKYLNFQQSYISLYQAIYATSINLGIHFEITEVDPETLTPDNVASVFTNCDGILVPGGFGTRGVDGKILAVNFARSHQIPFFGICLGFQVALIEFARNVLGLKNANSEEFVNPNNSDAHLVIHYFDKKQHEIIIGEKKLHLQPGTLLNKLFNKQTIYERFRNRLIFNNRYFLRFSRKGLVFSAFRMNKNQQFAVAFELPQHPFFVGVQFHFEINVMPEEPYPLLVQFFKSCYQSQQKK